MLMEPPNSYAHNYGAMNPVAQRPQEKRLRTQFLGNWTLGHEEQASLAFMAEVR